ncbi:DSD1 family PLP-dependent enzyme [Pseudohoeflea suaedae]|uniref:DSD1 family PLP-dependent enzyme n=1 Tax=Pseudohoeflea suaedae TaxID=877384 RepID=A0A4R5PNX6_9HYPH|nr:DSD1 family PLP-dependent enzyme [Pseudohoeflea suaedae]TDH38770.1 DSD1 family PLP-dependent enzyme [Pseudohoeflea suaedae]
MKIDKFLDGLTVGYDIPALPGMRQEEIVTPCLVIDLDRLETNLRTMGDFARRSGVKLRPHGKMHKSADIARLQMEIGGATGICCQKVSEAEAFVRAGITDILISNEIRNPLMIDRLARLCAEGAKISVCVDDPDAVTQLQEAAVRHETTITCLVEFETGGRRCGVSTLTELLEIARAIVAADRLDFGGVQAYHGMMQHIVSYEDRRSAAIKSIQHANAAVEMLRVNGIRCPRVTGGGTGSYAFEAGSRLYTELQCGSYAFMDVDYARIEDESGRRCQDFDQALFLLTSVMSTSSAGRAVCDAGLKVQSVDSGLPLVHDRDDVAYVSASDEHGTLTDPYGHLAVGDRLRLVPGHCDPTCNLHDWYVVMRHGRVETIWPVTARGKAF